MAKTLLDQKTADAVATIKVMSGPKAAGFDWSAILKAVIAAVLAALGGCALAPKQAGATLRRPGPLQRRRLRRIVAEVDGVAGHEDAVCQAVLDVGSETTDDEAAKLLCEK